MMMCIRSSADRDKVPARDVCDNAPTRMCNGVYLTSMGVAG